MAEKMMDYLRSQPTIWQEILAHHEEITADFTNKMKGFMPREIFAIGSGSSYNAACCAQETFAHEAGLRMTPVVPTRALEALQFSDPQKDLVLIISQSGESTSTIGILETLKKHGFTTVGLTQVANSSVAKNCSSFVKLSCGEETVGPKTKGFTATVLLLQLMAAHFAPAEKAKHLFATLSRACTQASDTIENSTKWAQKNSSLLSKASHIMLLSHGAQRQAMLEGALKLLETLYIPAVSYEFEEYLHGVHCTIDKNSTLILIVPNDEHRERMLRLASFNRIHGGNSLIISTGCPVGDENELFVETADSKHFTACYDVLLPLQVISALVSAEKGINCDLPKFASFNKEMKTKNW